LWPPDSEDTNEENGEENVSPKNNLDARQPAGDPPAAVMSAISRGELEESEKAVEKLRDLLRLAEKDQEDAMPKIRQILSEHPDLAQRFLYLGRMGEDILIERMTREGDLATRELFRCQLKAMREEIAGENPSPLERLLAERIVATWLQIQLFEGLYASGMSKKSMTIAEGGYHQKRLDQTYRRHLSAIRTLAQIRKLLKGTAITQINIADKQINTTG
jgi:hypothetical protein